MKTYSTILLLFVSVLGFTQNFPGKTWMQYNSVTDAGFSETKLSEIEKMHTDIGGAALLIVYNGAIVLSLGDPSRKLMDHSMRKSYLSALFGIHSGNGEINLNETLAELGIDDIQPLLAEEKKATVADLLSARSGVYHPSAYSPRGMIERLPARGSHPHGTFWYYNNWDFNTLATIFKQKTKRDLFEAFTEEIASPLQMQDYGTDDNFYRYEEISNHPAYLFRLSARDEARFGLLYMNKGKWNGKQIVPQQWVEQSTSPRTTELTNFDSREGYGYLWWTTVVDGHKGYYASGSGGQRIAVFPSRNLVIVQSTDTYDGSKNIGDSKIDELIAHILNSQTENVTKKPGLKPLVTKPFEYPNFKIDMNIAKNYSGDYEHRLFGTMSIQFDKGTWMLKTNTGNFKLHPASNTEFIPEDIRFRLVMEKAENPEDKGKIKPKTNPDRSLASVHFFY